MELKKFYLTDEDILCSQNGLSAGDLLKFKKYGLYIKTSSFIGHDKIYMFDSISEYIASQVCRATGFRAGEYVDYKLCLVIYRGKEYLSCYSESFLNEGNAEEYYDIDCVNDRFRLNWNENDTSLDIYDFADGISKTGIPRDNIVAYIKKMSYIDFITLNYDRHYRNWGVVIGCGGARMVPLFDFGSSFFARSRIHISDADYICENVKDMKPFGISYGNPQIPAEVKGTFQTDLGAVCRIADELNDAQLLPIDRIELIKNILRRNVENYNKSEYQY